MALRKQDIDNNDEQTTQTAKRSRITIDISPELRRRIKLAAIENDLSISEYVGQILEEAVPDEVSTTQRQRHQIPDDFLDKCIECANKSYEILRANFSRTLQR